MTQRDAAISRFFFLIYINIYFPVFFLLVSCVCVVYLVSPLVQFSSPSVPPNFAGPVVDLFYIRHFSLSPPSILLFLYHYVVEFD